VSRNVIESEICPSNMVAMPIENELQPLNLRRGKFSVPQSNLKRIESLKYCSIAVRRRRANSIIVQKINSNIYEINRQK
jgi:hypothetical protein